MSAVPPEMKRSNSPRAYLLRWLALGVLTCLLWGCGTGGDAFDGGGIPPGGGSGTKLVGLAFNAESTTTTVPGAVVTLVNYPIGATPRNLSTVTDAKGNFQFNTSNFTATSNQISVMVTPPNGSDRAAQHLTFLLPGGVNSTLLLALPSKTFQQNTVASLAITPALYQININDTVHIGAALQDLAGDVLPLTPSLLFEGSFGYLLTDGLFYSIKSGSGNIVALWDTTDNTGFGELQSTAQVSVSTVTNSEPPPPPSITTTVGTSGVTSGKPITGKQASP